MQAIKNWEDRSSIRTRPRRTLTLDGSKYFFPPNDQVQSSPPLIPLREHFESFAKHQREQHHTEEELSLEYWKRQREGNKAVVLPFRK